MIFKHSQLDFQRTCPSRPPPNTPPLLVDSFSFVDTELVEGYRQFMVAPLIEDEQEHTFTLQMYASKLLDSGEVDGPYDVLADDNSDTVVEFIQASPTLTSKKPDLIPSFRSEEAHRKVRYFILCEGTFPPKSVLKLQSP